MGTEKAWGIIAFILELLVAIGCMTVIFGFGALLFTVAYTLFSRI